MKLVLEGGGSRAAYSAGILAELARREVRFDAVVGSSTSAANAAFFVAGQADRAEKVWREVIPNDFISYRRLLTPWGAPGLAIDRMMDVVLRTGDTALDVDAAVSAETALYIVATEVPEGRTVIVRPTRDDLFEWMRASSAIPVGYNRVVEIGGRRFVDGGMTAPVAFDEPIDTAVDGPTVVLLTRPMVAEKPPPSWWQALFIRTLVPGPVRALAIRQHHLHNALMQRLVAARETGEVIVVDPPPAMRLSRLSRDRGEIDEGIRIGREVGAELAAERLDHLRTAAQ